tara:strand:+ start:307 stop:465 length:159 start_codon:yes stop_codon:yes gene_type:complete
MNLTEGFVFFLIGMSVTVVGFFIAFYVAFKRLEQEKEDERQRKKPKIFNDYW